MRTPPGDTKHDMYWDIGPGTMSEEEWEEACRARAIRLRYDSCRIDPDGSDGRRLQFTKWLATTFTLGIFLLACGGSGSVPPSPPGVATPIHAQARFNGKTIDIKCWRITDDNGRPTIVYHQYGADPHLTDPQATVIERDCLHEELIKGGWIQMSDGYWVR